METMLSKRLGWSVSAAKVVVLLLNLSLGQGEGVNLTSTSKRLANDLLSNYGSRFVRPVRNHTKPVQLFFRAKPLWFADFDEAKQLLTITTLNQVKWKDEYLMWNPEDYDGIEKLKFGKDQIWFPDITAYERVDSGSAESNIEKTFPTVNYKGEVVYYNMMLLSVFCKMDVRLFPLDSHDCGIRFTPYSYQGDEVALYYTSDSDATENILQKNGVWFVTDINVEEVEFLYLCCPEPFRELHYTLHVQRESGFYLLNFGVPTLLLSLTTVAVFLLHPESGEKISLCVNNVLALIIFQQLLAASMPPTGDQTPIVAYYFIVVIALSFLSVLSTSLTLGMYHHDGSRPPPGLLRRFVKRNHGRRGSTGGHRTSVTKNVEVPCESIGMDEVDFIHPTNFDSTDQIFTLPYQKPKKKKSKRSSKMRRCSVGISPTITPVNISNDVTDSMASTFQEEWKRAATLVDKFMFCFSLAFMIIAILVCALLFLREMEK
ncbi:Neuronal acetylcholine receptor subunit alpha-7 [Holothuria leucospilota]|uniref:Neuronal acetylcholine receptor subunit alpha-7 n=1 Tax=Holothuria leucospilota TaxID=206669 RepID=A0A9Q1CFP1_HOLLE|nr:Neuronal acetylcholine receptor subunit alpha-7 [Holothuria leucospilota]